MNKNKIGLAIGFALSLLHLIWALAVGLIPSQTQKGVDWIMNLHGIRPYITLTSMTLVNAILLIIVTFIAGYIIGWLIGYFHDLCDKKKRK